METKRITGTMKIQQEIDDNIRKCEIALEEFLNNKFPYIEKYEIELFVDAMSLYGTDPKHYDFISEKLKDHKTMLEIFCIKHKIKE